jgi:hypothetical protein
MRVTRMQQPKVGPGARAWSRPPRPMPGRDCVQELVGRARLGEAFFGACFARRIRLIPACTDCDLCHLGEEVVEEADDVKLVEVE